MATQRSAHIGCGWHPAGPVLLMVMVEQRTLPPCASPPACSWLDTGPNRQAHKLPQPLFSPPPSTPRPHMQECAPNNGCEHEAQTTRARDDAEDARDAQDAHERQEAHGRRWVGAADNHAKDGRRHYRAVKPVPVVAKVDTEPHRGPLYQHLGSKNGGEGEVSGGQRESPGV
jgi:hypothetical protein